MEVFKVGGCVRDKLMGIEPNDIDFVVVGSTPEEMIEKGFSQVGESFPVFIDDNGDEYALARTEKKVGKGYTGFTTEHDPSVTLMSDLMRRDLTINAMAESEDGSIEDPFGGRKDLENKVLRNVSFAFAEDPVRVLRIARFNARFGKEWSIHHDTKWLIASMIGDGALDELTPERVWKEMEKALSTSSPHVFFDALFEVGALGVIFPEMRHIDLDDIEKSISNSIPNTVIRFAKVCLLIHDEDDVAHMFERLRVPNEYVKAYNVMKILHTVFFTFINPIDDMLTMVNQSSLDRDLFVACCNALVGEDGLTDIVINAFDAGRKVNFECLSDKQKSELKGAEIGQALDEIKRKEMSRIFGQ